MALRIPDRRSPETSGSSTRSPYLRSGTPPTERVLSGSRLEEGWKPKRRRLRPYLSLAFLRKNQLASLGGQVLNVQRHGGLVFAWRPREPVRLFPHPATQRTSDQSNLLRSSTRSGGVRKN